LETGATPQPFGQPGLGSIHGSHAVDATSLAMNSDFSAWVDLLSAHQDYLWFLAALCWMGVWAAGAREGRSSARTTPKWLLGLTSAQLLWSVTELALLGLDVQPP